MLKIINKCAVSLLTVFVFNHSAALAEVVGKDKIQVDAGGPLFVSGREEYRLECVVKVRIKTTPDSKVGFSIGLTSGTEKTPPQTVFHFSITENEERERERQKNFRGNYKSALEYAAKKYGPDISKVKLSEANFEANGYEEKGELTNYYAWDGVHSLYRKAYNSDKEFLRKFLTEELSFKITLVREGTGEKQEYEVNLKGGVRDVIKKSHAGCLDQLEKQVAERRFPPERFHKSTNK